MSATVRVAVAVALVVGWAGVGLAATPATAQPGGPGPPARAGTPPVEVGTGAQLSTVLSVTGDGVRTAVGDAGFERSLARGNESERAAAVVQWAAVLRERAGAIRGAHRRATDAHRAGTLSTSAYAQRLATLNARAEHVLASAGRLLEGAATVDPAALEAAGWNRSAVRAAVADLEVVRGVGTAALLDRFTGQFDGRVRLETDEGTEIEVRSDDEEWSREFEGRGDASANLTVDRETARSIARDALTVPPANGTWELERADTDEDDGVYAFRFVLRASGSEGEARVVVDGSAARVVSLEEEVEREG